MSGVLVSERISSQHSAMKLTNSTRQVKSSWLSTCMRAHTCADGVPWQKQLCWWECEVEELPHTGPNMQLTAGLLHAAV